MRRGGGAPSFFFLPRVEVGDQSEGRNAGTRRPPPAAGGASQEVRALTCMHRSICPEGKRAYKKKEADLAEDDRCPGGFEGVGGSWGYRTLTGGETAPGVNVWMGLPYPLSTRGLDIGHPPASDLYGTRDN